MSPTAAEMSWDDIKALFRETDRKFQETDRKFQETRELLQASANTGLMRATGRRLGGNW